jgi:hypothetical protein
MLDRLRADAPRNGRGDAELVVYVADARRSGLVPAPVRAVLCQALALLPHLTITQRVANLAGRTGVATGEYIGERTVRLTAQPGGTSRISERVLLGHHDRGGRARRPALS